MIPSTNAVSQRRAGLAQFVVAELALLLLTITAGTLLVALIVYAPRLFFGEQAWTWAGLQNYLGGVLNYVSGLFRGDLGQNRFGESGTQELLEAAKRSLQLITVSALVALPLGLLWGAALATLRGKTGALLFGLSTLIVSLPTFAIMLFSTQAIATFTLRQGVQIAYVQGYGMDRHLVVPAGVLALRGAAYLARAVRVAQEDTMQQDWVQYARAKGLGGWQLWRRHIAPALRLPLLGSTLGMLRVIVSGLVIVDYLYNWGGLGRKMIQVNNGVASQNENGVAAGAVVLFIVFFVVVDAVGRVVARRADPRSGEAG